MALGVLESKKILGSLPPDFSCPILNNLMALVWVLPEPLAALGS